eukprot:scaffold55331_cov23-Tisochrysis_lutea.AAC.5
MIVGVDSLDVVIAVNGSCECFRRSCPKETMFDVFAFIHVPPHEHSNAPCTLDHCVDTYGHGHDNTSRTRAAGS